jgi:hypothetical protein
LVLLHQVPCMFIQPLKSINHLNKITMKKLINNALHNIWTSLSGTIAGVPVIAEGIAEKNTTKIVSGMAILLLGLLAKED